MLILTVIYLCKKYNAIERVKALLWFRKVKVVVVPIPV
ncbi:hypothetical protein RG47T_1240 [Mucilaginibacter polytrichastri]|uniref:Uncharacterized protein n=1 Tax=Mucilaginibacter polytrichastri TaxID=1302689 RepID=A0A1Q5ZVJ4_9SPHI|nr:hypothetical protein RG47T_1240 [Mucilaginibacter polytrichastri]